METMPSIENLANYSGQVKSEFLEKNQYFTTPA